MFLKQLLITTLFCSPTGLINKSLKLNWNEISLIWNCCCKNQFNRIDSVIFYYVVFLERTQYRLFAQIYYVSHSNSSSAKRYLSFRESSILFERRMSKITNRLSRVLFGLECHSVSQCHDQERYRSHQVEFTRWGWYLLLNTRTHGDVSRIPRLNIIRSPAFCGEGDVYLTLSAWVNRVLRRKHA